MGSDLAHHVAGLRVADTHEHLLSEREWVEAGPGDVLADLFENYAAFDLVSAGADPAAVRALADADGDPQERWSAVAGAWDAVRFTGFGEAVRIQAREVYGIDELSAEAMVRAGPKLEAMRRPGQRLALLRDRAKLDHVQVDDFCWDCGVDASGPGFFFYDLSWARLSGGKVEPEPLEEATGASVGDLASLRRALEGVWDRHGGEAVALKTQHAYSRTLHWQARSDADAEAALRVVLREGPEAAPLAARLCLGDWCLARGVELASERGLPVKIHTGLMARNNRMPLHELRPGLLCPLLRAYPDARFVLMHIGYPFGDELIALAKHYANVHADLCWAWSIDPPATARFVRHFIHAAPCNKLLAFGGDARTPTAAFACSLQARRWLTRTLEREVAEALLSEADAMDLATRLLRTNALALFNIDRRRAAVAGVTA